MAELTLDQVREAVRQVVREEIAAALPGAHEGPALLSIRETAKKYRLGYDTVRAMAKSGELLSIDRPAGRCGAAQTMIVAASAAKKLGGVIV